MARPSVLSQELSETIERELEDGIPIAIVAQNVGIGRSTLHERIASGRIELRRPVTPLELVASPAPEDPDQLAALRRRKRDR